MATCARDDDALSAAEPEPRCPRCGYNLTGLPAPRCPECGTVFDWEEVRRAAANPPQIYFERVHGWRKVPGFFVTGATVLFAPWVFARQAVARVSTAHALVFALLCFAGAFVTMLSGAPLSFMLTWLTTALLYIPLQTVLFGVLDLSGWHQPLRSLWFWLLIGCYTSAIMLTEVAIGPPPVGLSDLTDLVAVRAPSHFVSDMYHWSWESAICWAQMSVWLIGLMSCYLVRLRRERRQPALVLLATLVTALATLVLYSTAVEHIGGRLDGLFN